MRKIFKLFRVRHWIKNKFIFAPLIFSGHLFSRQQFLASLFSYAGFCLVTSGIYILNDFLDRHGDLLHPKKAQRFPAYHELDRKLVIAIVSVTMIAGFVICAAVNRQVVAMALVYAAVNLIYNFFTKNVVMLDVVSVALGFLIRIWMGAFAIRIHPSLWLQICVFLLALFLGFSKRKQELSLLGEKARRHRPVLGKYTVGLLNRLIIVCAVMTVFFYFLYTVSYETVTRLGSHAMFYSGIFVVSGLCRYFYLVHIKRLEAEPGELIFEDKIFMANIFLWVGYVIFVLYTQTR